MRGTSGSVAGSAAGSAAGLAAAVLACAAAVLLATGLGAPAVSGDSPLDRWQLVDGASEEPAVEEEVAVAPQDTVIRGEPALGIPAEVLGAMLFTVVAAALLVRSVLQARTDDDRAHPADEPDLDEVGGGVDVDAVAAAARRGLLRLQDVPAADADEVVIACWVELELAGGRLGAGPARTDTPTDFARRLAVAVTAADPERLDDLRRTYSRVRYGTGGASTADVERARQALADLLAATGRRP